MARTRLQRTAAAEPEPGRRPWASWPPQASSDVWGPVPVLRGSWWMGVGYVLGEACQDPASPHTVRGPVPHGRPGGCLLALLAVSGNKAVLEKAVQGG